MSLTVGELVGYIDIDNKGFNSKLDAADSRFSGFAKGLGVAIAAAGVAAAAGIGLIIKTGFAEMSEASGITAQLEAGIKSTGNAANVTVDGMNSLASSIQSYSGQTDDSIASAESLLLTFTNIKNVGVDRIFDQATVATANMAAKMGGEASTYAIQLGKALNDPIKGVASLTRMGIQFTDAQKDSIKAMVEAGDVMGAQKVILAELETQFGGAAEAAGTALPGQLERLKRAFEDVAQSALERFMPSIQKALGYILDHMPQIQAVVERVFGAIGSAFGWIAENVWPVLQKVFSDMKSAVGDSSSGLGGAFSGIIGIIAGVREIFLAAWPVILGAVQMFVEWLSGPAGKALIEALLQAVGTAMSIVQGIFQAAWPLIQSAVQMFVDFFNSESGQRLISSLLGLIQVAMGAVQSIFQAAWPIITSVVQGFIDWFNSPEGQALIKSLIDAVSAAMQTLQTLWQVAWPAMQAVINAAGPIVKVALNLIIAAVNILTHSLEAATAAWNRLFATQASKPLSPGVNSTGVGTSGTARPYTVGGTSIISREHGGSIPGQGPVPIMAHGGEYMLTKGDTSLMQRLIGAIGKGGMGHGGNTFNFYGVKNMEDGADKFLKRLVTAGVTL